MELHRRRGGRAVGRRDRALPAAGYDVVDVDPAPFVAAADLFDAWRATDDYADLRALVAGRETELTAHIAQLLATPPVAADVPTSPRGRRRGRRVARVDADPRPAGREGGRASALDATSVEIDGRTESIDALQILAPSRAVSLLGLPALAIPAGLDSRGLPIGVQLVGRPGAEHDAGRPRSAHATRLASTPAFGDAPVTTVDDHL